MFTRTRSNMHIARIFSVLFIFSSLASSQEIKQPLVGSELSLIYPIEKGQQAPFPGVLLSSRASAVVIAEYSLFEDRLKIEVDNAVRLTEVKMNYELKQQESSFLASRTVLQAQLSSREEKIKILERNLKQLEEDNKRLIEETPSRITWLGLGFAGGIVFTIATAYAIGQVVN